MGGFRKFRRGGGLWGMITGPGAITAAAIVVYFYGQRGTFDLLILSQVILSMQLPFAVIPLIHFTSDRGRMGSFANKKWLAAVAWGQSGHTVRPSVQTFSHSVCSTGDGRAVRCLVRLR